MIPNLIDWNLRPAKLAERPNGRRRRSGAAKPPAAAPGA